MTSFKKPLLAVIALMTAVFASLLLTAGPASAAYPAGSTAGITITPNPAHCGDTVTVTGSHYNPGEEVTVTADGAQYGPYKAGSDGSFSATFKLTCSGTEPVTIMAKGNQGDVDSLTVHTTGGGSGSGGNSGGGNSGSGGLSSTGVAVVGIGAVGVVLLLGGGLLLFAGKRRRVSA